jgi:hypothetical protein
MIASLDVSFVPEDAGRRFRAQIAASDRQASKHKTVEEENESFLACHYRWSSDCFGIHRGGSIE